MTPRYNSGKYIQQSFSSFLAKAENYLRNRNIHTSYGLYTRILKTSEQILASLNSSSIYILHHTSLRLAPESPRVSPRILKTSELTAPFTCRTRAVPDHTVGVSVLQQCSWGFSQKPQRLFLLMQRHFCCCGLLFLTVWPCDDPADICVSHSVQKLKFIFSTNKQ